MNYKTVTKIITILLIIATILGAVNMVFADTAQGIDIPNGASGGITTRINEHYIKCYWYCSIYLLCSCSNIVNSIRC
jgi:hypothetical protein